MQLPHSPKYLTGHRAKVLDRYLRQLVPARKRKYTLIELLAPMAYLARTGAHWHALDDDKRFPPCGTVYYYFRKWTEAGVFDRLNAMLVKRLRSKSRGRNRARTRACQHGRPEPTACVIDSQSVKSRVWGRREARGFDGNKRVNGIKYHAAVDTDGRILACVVGPANAHDSQWLPDLLDAVRYAGFGEVRHVFADAAYEGTDEYARSRGCTLDIVRRTDFVAAKKQRAKKLVKPFTPVPKRWVVERTFAHMTWYRRLTASWDRVTEVVESWVLLGSICHSVRHLAKFK